MVVKFFHKFCLGVPLTGTLNYRINTDLGGEQDGVVEADLHLAKSPGGGNKLLVSLPYILLKEASL